MSGKSGTARQQAAKRATVDYSLYSAKLLYLRSL